MSVLISVRRYVDMYMHISLLMSMYKKFRKIFSKNDLKKYLKKSIFLIIKNLKNILKKKIDSIILDQPRRWSKIFSITYRAPKAGPDHGGLPVVAV